MWQDGLALLIVAGAAIWLARDYLSLAFWRRLTGSKRDEEPAISSGCSGCSSGSSCSKARIKVYPDFARLSDFNQWC